MIDITNVLCIIADVLYIYFEVELPNARLVRRPCAVRRIRHRDPFV